MTRWRRLRRPPRRRLEVLRHLAEGYTAPQIAERLAIAPKTVMNHVALLRMETGAFTSAHLVSIGFRQGWLE